MLKITNEVVSTLRDRYGQGLISRSSLIMTIHYFLRDQLHNRSSNTEYIKSTIDALMIDGIIKRESNQKYRVV